MATIHARQIQSVRQKDYKVINLKQMITAV